MGHEGGDQAPAKMRNEIWGHISKNEWEAFVAKKPTPTKVASIPLYYSF